MQQYRIEFFKNSYAEHSNGRKLEYVHHDFMSDVAIDDDYLSISSTVVSISPTTKVGIGNIVRILREEQDYFFGIVSDVSNAEKETRVTFKPFISIFDEDILFDVTDQTYLTEIAGKTLEETLKKYITNYYISNSDYLQDYPMTITIPDSQYLTKNWGFGLYADSEDSTIITVNLYRELVVQALKAFGVSVIFRPNFSTGKIAVTISRISQQTHVDADLDNVTVKTFKVNERAASINKLTVYDTVTLYSLDYYVHPDMSYGRTDTDKSQNRVTPVNRAIRSVTISGAYSEDPLTDFMYEADAAAYEELSGLEWNNLIELDCMPNDPLVSPMAMRIGQKVVIHYNKVAYTTILTGKAITYETVTLMFGSERIAFSKKRK